MITSMLILLNKIITWVCKIFKKNGTVLPASFVLPIDKKILTKVKYPKYVIGVTGSSGKGTTTSLIAHILKENGLNVVWNASGSNVVNGTATLILNNTGLFSHKMKCEVLLLEMDEAYIKETFKKSTLTHLVVTNITRDQPARNGEPEIILNKIKKSVDDNIHFILNADDSFVNRLGIDKSKVTYYGIAKNAHDIKKPLSSNLDGAYCPLCSAKLKYNFYHYGHMGSYKCLKCDYQRKTDYEAKDIDLKKGSIVINKHSIHLNNNAFFNVYSTLAAFALAKEIGLNDEGILKALNINILPSKRLKTLSLGKRDIIMLESKNENNLSYFQSLDYINNYKGKKSIILGFDNVSRRYKYNDLSWLYDVDFEHLDMKNIDLIYCIGKFRYDVALRLTNAKISNKKIILVDDVYHIKKLLSKSKGSIFTMVCFDMTEILKKIFIKGDEDEN